jgi:Lon protease-like protein
MKDVTIIPIFPLKLVLLPETTLALHIFEPKYKEMIKYCVDEQVEFGIINSDGTEIEKVGCTARLSKIIKTYEDGRMDILTKGHQRFRVKDLSEEETYLQASVDYFDDEHELETPEMVNLAGEGIQLLNDLEKVAHRKENFDDLNEVNMKVLSFLIANAPGIQNHRKQHFLEMTLTSERLREGVNDLKEVLENMIFVSQLEKSIKMPEKVNGFYLN